MLVVHVQCKSEWLIHFVSYLSPRFILEMQAVIYSPEWDSEQVLILALFLVVRTGYKYPVTSCFNGNVYMDCLNRAVLQATGADSSHCKETSVGN